MTAAFPNSIDETITLLSSGSYVADRALATVVYLSLKMGRPLFLEGEAGVGKTEVAKVLSAALGRRLVRLQCYEGLDSASALYEWNHAAQMIAIRLAEAGGAATREKLAEDVFSERFLTRRPLLDALSPDPAGAPVVFLFHGFGNTHDGLLGLDGKASPYEVWLDIAAREGLILVVP